MLLLKHHQTFLFWCCYWSIIKHSSFDVAIEASPNIPLLIISYFLPNDEYLELSKLKALSRRRIKICLNVVICLRKDRKHCIKRQKCCLYKNFMLFPQCFLKLIINSLPNDKISDLSKFKGFADDKISMTKRLKFISEKLEYIVGKGENAGFPAFSPFPTMFSKVVYRRVDLFKSWNCVVKSLTLSQTSPGFYVSTE